MSNGFVNWDDDVLIYANPRFRGLGWEQWRWMFFGSAATPTYQPLCWIVYDFLYLLLGLNPAAYHAASLSIYAATGALLTLLASRFAKRTLGLPDSPVLAAGAGLASLLWLLHPLQNELVASAVGLSPLMADFFFLASVLAYLEAVEPAGQRRRWLAISWLLALGAGLSHWQEVSLPLVLVVLDVYPLRRLKSDPGRWLERPARALWLEKLPFAALSAAVLGANAWTRAQSIQYHAVGSRPVEACSGLMLFLWKTLVPTELMPYYALTGSGNPMGWSAAECVLTVICLTALLWLMRRRFPAGLAAWVCYAGALAPVLGFSRDGPVYVHDAYAFLACLGAPLILSGWLVKIWRSWTLRKSAAGLLPMLLAATALPVLSTLTRRQIRVWHDPVTLWRHALAVEPRYNLANYRLASFLLRHEGRPYEAIYYFRRQLLTDPDNARRNLGYAFNSLGTAQFRQGRTKDAVKSFSEALRWDPERPEILKNLAAVRRAKGAEGSRHPE